MIIMRYDLRIPPAGSPAHGVTASGQYAACLEQVKWADRIGLDMVVLSEHHGTDDGFMPAPITLAAAVAAATERIGINISAALVIMHDPVRLAEQIATVDLIAKGRMSVICGTGYRQEEFEMAGLEFKNRFSALEESVSVMRQAWTGEYFNYRGRQVKVRPLPHTAGGPMLLMGGSTPVAARRAARLRCFFSAANDDQAVADAYNEECAKEGFQGSLCCRRKPLALFMFLTTPNVTGFALRPTCYTKHSRMVRGSGPDNRRSSMCTMPKQLRVCGRVASMRL